MNQDDTQLSAEQVANSIQGKTLAEIFDEGPRKLFITRNIPGHGTYRLYISRPFGVVKPAGLRWRVQINVQYEGKEELHSVNDGVIIVPLVMLGAVIVDADEQMSEHIKANRQVAAQVRREAMKALQPEALVVEPMTMGRQGVLDA